MADVTSPALVAWPVGLILRGLGRAAGLPRGSRVGTMAGAPNPLDLVLSLTRPLDDCADRFGRLRRNLALHPPQNSELPAQAFVQAGQRARAILRRQGIRHVHQLPQHLVITLDGHPDPRPVSLARQDLGFLQPLVGELEQKRRVPLGSRRECEPRLFDPKLDGIESLPRKRAFRSESHADGRAHEGHAEQ
jgi:hypothetical protein